MNETIVDADQVLDARRVVLEFISHCRKESPEAIKYCLAYGFHLDSIKVSAEVGSVLADCGLGRGDSFSC